MSDTSGWYIEDRSCGAPESLFALSNGYLGIRGAAEEPSSADKRGVYVNGFFERSPIQYGEEAYGNPKWHETIVGAPRAGLARFSLDGAELGKDGSMLHATRRLDLRRGVLERRAAWEFPDGRVVEVFSERFVSLERPRLAAFRVRYRVLSGGLARLESILDPTPANARAGDDPRVGAKFAGEPYAVVASGTSGSTSRVAILTRRSRLALGCAVRNDAFRFRADAAGGSNRDAVTVVAIPGVAEKEPAAEACGEPQTARFASTLEAGDELELRMYAVYHRDPCCGSAGPAPDGRDDAGLAEELARDAAAEADAASEIGFGALLAKHADTLGGFWESAGFELDGPPGLEAAIRFNMFHVFQAAGRDGSTNAPAKGLTGEGYEGHCFWDTEIYLLPLLTYTAPDIARSLVAYRHSILGAARERARELGHEAGALFPWRTISGAETSAYFPAGSAQYHIDADVAYAALRYARAAGDVAFLDGPTLDILAETARLWIDAGHYGRDGRFRIDGVTGPDEYSALVNNNAYTNAMARANLSEAAMRFEDLRVRNPGAFAAAAERLLLGASEPESWSDAAHSMYMPYDETSGLIPQDDSFMDRAPWDLPNTPREKFPLLLHYHPLAIYRRQVLKQPDLLLAMMLLGREFSLAEKIRNFAFYEPLTTGDSSLSHCVMSVIAAEVGQSGKAWDYFMRTVRMDLDDLHGNASHGVHIAAMGGSWLSLVYGFAGFRDDGGYYRFSPRLPAAITRLCFSLLLSGGRLSLELAKDRAGYSWDGPSPIVISHDGASVKLDPGSAASFDQRPRLKAVIFDLDGVIADTASLHYRAWKRLADEFGVAFDETKNESLKGRSRTESLDLILEGSGRAFSEGERAAMAERKNGYYRELAAALGPGDALPGAVGLIAELRSAGIKAGLASASRNAPEVLARLGLSGAFDAIADPAKSRPKPDPELFLAAAEALGVRPCDCVGIEDAQAGIDAIRSAGMRSVAIGLSLAGADLTLASTLEASVATIKGLFAD